VDNPVDRNAIAYNAKKRTPSSVARRAYNRRRS
jgi:hypothetical protein